MYIKNNFIILSTSFHRIIQWYFLILFLLYRLNKRLFFHFDFSLWFNTFVLFLLQFFLDNLNILLFLIVYSIFHVLFIKMLFYCMLIHFLELFCIFTIQHYCILFIKIVVWIIDNHVWFIDSLLLWAIFHK